MPRSQPHGAASYASLRDARSLSVLILTTKASPSLSPVTDRAIATLPWAGKLAADSWLSGAASEADVPALVQGTAAETPFVQRGAAMGIESGLRRLRRSARRSAPLTRKQTLASSNTISLFYQMRIIRNSLAFLSFSVESVANYSQQDPERVE